VPGRVVTRERRSDSEGIAHSLVAGNDSPCIARRDHRAARRPLAPVTGRSEALRLRRGRAQAPGVPDEVSSGAAEVGATCFLRDFLR
jgi:hypothetical protein